MGSPVDSSKHLVKKLQQFSTISSRRYEQRDYFLTHPIRTPKPDEDIRKENYRPRSLMNTDAKILRKKVAN